MNLLCNERTIEQHAIVSFELFPKTANIEVFGLIGLKFAKRLHHVLRV